MNIQKRIEALETEFNEKIKTLKAEVKQREDFPQDGDGYWYIDDYGYILNEKWDGIDFEEFRLEIGNVFKTKEQAEFAVEKLKVEVELRKFSRPFERGVNNHSLLLEIYNNRNRLDIGVSNCYQAQGAIYFESEEKAQKAIESVGEERIKKYIFGVED